MALVVPNASEVVLLNVLLGKAAQESLLLKLFTNNYIPVFSTVLGDLTEAVVTGYAPITLAAAAWTVTSSGGVSGPGVASTAQQQWTLGGAVSVYGYYLVGATSGLLWYVERFTDGPYVLAAAGGIIKVTPSLGGASGSQN